MSAKSLSESTLRIKKIVSKNEVIKNEEKLSNSISEAIQCLVNTVCSKSKYALVDININVASIEIEEKEGSVVNPVSSERPAIEGEECVNKVIIIDESCSDTFDSTTNITHELVQLEKLELRNTPIKNLQITAKKENANKSNNSSQQEELKNKLNKNEKVNNREVAETDKQCLNQLNAALEQLLKNRRVSQKIIHKKFQDLKKVKDRKKKNKIANKRKQISNTNNAPNSVKASDDIDFTGEPSNKKRKTGIV